MSLRLISAPLVLLASLALAAPVLAADDTAEAPAEPGAPAEPEPEAIGDFTLPNLAGGNTSLSDHLGEKVVLINFWATWCTPCMKEMPKLNEIQKEHGDKVQIISISADEAKDMTKVKAIVQRLQYEPIVLLDAETKVVAQLNKRKDMPYTLLIGKDKMIHHRKKGFTDGDEVELLEMVLALAAD